jgi:GDPmannose 4,6-dehydratase
MLVKEMVAVDVDHFHKEKLLRANGYMIKNQFE